MKTTIPPYQWELLPQIATHIERRASEKAHRDLSALMKILVHDSFGDLSLFKMRCSQTTSACIRGARRGGARSDVLMNEHVEFLKKLAALRTWAAVKSSMHRYLDHLMAQVKPAQSSNMERAVAKIRKHLRSHLGSTRTLAQYAADFGISSAHLSRSFATIAGRPFREELRQVRTEAARKMLLKSNEKVSTIARRLGVGSTSQFIADFKADTGLTPAAFRREIHPQKKST
jgi:AraC-like DNA-binding protein